MSEPVNKFQTRCLHSLVKVFPDEPLEGTPYYKGTALLNEAYSFQVAYWSELYAKGLKVSIESALAQFVGIYEVGLVPADYPAPGDHDNDFLRTAPGLFPDPLYPVDLKEGLTALPGQWRSIWVAVNPEGQMVSGTYPITIRFQYSDGVQAGEETFTLELIGASLPEQQLTCTNWFHADCLATYYGTEVFSELHWELIGRFVETAAAHGINTILTPVFTPPLDTEEGRERPTVQLVGVTRKGDNYQFCFDRLGRWIRLCRERKIRFFEISHLFTQWGARHAPKIIAEENGECRRIFGWETDAYGDEYREFLSQFLPELVKYLNEQGLGRNVFFHVSDEPALEHIENYKKARNIIEEYVKDFPIIDALSSYEFYKQGLIRQPVVCNDHIEPFLENGVPALWTYYCCGQYKEVANRFFAMPSHRNRILGYQLYKYDLAGFLHWAYNFWYSGLSRKWLNPFVSTDSGRCFPSGDAFVVYPGENGYPIESIRLKVFNEALQDMRAMRLLEELAGREHVLALLEEGLEEPLTFSQYPRNADWLLDKRESINMELKSFASMRQPKK